MIVYRKDVEQNMKRFYDSLSEKERRRYAAIEVAKLDHGGIDYIAKLFGCDPRTIRHGKHDLQDLSALTPGRIRKKGVDVKEL